VQVKTLSQRLGHADVAVTLRIYAHVLPGDDEAAAAIVAAAIMRTCQVPVPVFRFGFGSCVPVPEGVTRR